EGKLILAGILFDVATNKPLGGAQIKEINSGIEGKSDAKGYYVLEIPLENREQEFEFSFICSKSNYQQRSWSMKSNFNKYSKPVSISLVGMVNARDVERGIQGIMSAYSSDMWENGKDNPANYLIVMQKFDAYLYGKKVDTITGKSSKPVWIIDGIPYAIG